MSQTVQTSRKCQLDISIAFRYSTKVKSTGFRAVVSKLTHGQKLTLLPIFWAVHKLRMAYTFLSGWKMWKQKYFSTHESYDTCSLKSSPSGPLQRKFSIPALSCWVLNSNPDLCLAKLNFFKPHVFIFKWYLPWRFIVKQNGKLSKALNLVSWT